MSGMTSGKVYRDPLPWQATTVYGAHLGRYPNPVPGYGHWGPRDEFDNHNPILRYFRDEVARYGNPAHGDYARWLEPLSEPGRMTLSGKILTAEHIDHARRVLTKLANLEGTTK